MTITPPWRFPAVWLLALIFVMLWAANGFLMPVLNVGLDASDISGLVTAISVFFAISTLPHLVYSRIEASPTPVGHGLKTVLKGIGNWSGFVCAFVLLGMAQAMFSYLMVAMAMPLQDAVLSSIDKAVGFEWLAFLEWTNAIPELAHILALAYDSSRLQILLVAAILAFTCTEKMWDFLALLMICLTITLAISGLVPALSPYNFYNPDPSTYSYYTGFGVTPGLDFLQHYKALRSGDGFVLAFGQTQGLVTFPSYHTVVALLIPYALRHWPFLFWPAAIVSAIVIVSTLPVGGHYLVDLFGGGGIVVIGVYLLKQWKRYAPREIALLARAVVTRQTAPT